jgi:hypothetical protein
MYWNIVNSIVRGGGCKVEGVVGVFSNRKRPVESVGQQLKIVHIGQGRGEGGG